MGRLRGPARREPPDRRGAPGQVQGRTHRPRDRGRVVGGEEDGIVGAIDEKLYSTPEDAIATAEALGVEGYLTALTFGNVHGVYKPGGVQLRPEILRDAQQAVVEKLGLAEGSKPFNLVFHGGSGSSARRSPPPSPSAWSR